MIREVEYESCQESNTNWGLCETSDNDDSSEEETQAWIKSEEPRGQTSLLEIHIIISPPFIKESNYEDPMWPAPPPQSFGP